MAGINVTAKEIERVSHKLGEEAEGFQKEQVNEALSDKIVPITSVPAMYICIDGTGVPMVKAETVHREGKRQDGGAKTREVKLGCVFKQSTADEEGNPVRDEGSTSYDKVNYLDRSMKLFIRYDYYTLCHSGLSRIFLITFGCLKGIDIFRKLVHYETNHMRDY